MPTHLADLYDVSVKYPSGKVLATAVASVEYGKATYIKQGGGIGEINIFNYPLGGYPMHSSSLAINREYFYAIGGFSSKYFFFEDRELYYRMAEDVGNFHVNFKVSSLYLHDACQKVTDTCKIPLCSRWGFLDFAESCIAVGAGSKRMWTCAYLSLKEMMRGFAIHGKWDRFCECTVAFPHILKRPFFWPIFYNKTSACLYFLYETLLHRLRKKPVYMVLDIDLDLLMDKEL